MEVSSQLHAPAALPSKKETSLPTEQETEWAYSRTGRFWGKKISYLWWESKLAYHVIYFLPYFLV